MRILCVTSLVLLPAGYWGTAEAAVEGDEHWQVGFALPGLDGQVLALIEQNGDIIAGGHFTRAGSVTVNHIARWDGAGWSALGTGMDGAVFALAVYDATVRKYPHREEARSAQARLAALREAASPVSPSTAPVSPAR